MKLKLGYFWEDKEEEEKSNNVDAIDHFKRYKKKSIKFS